MVFASAVLAATLTGCQFIGTQLIGTQQSNGDVVIGADLELSGAAAPLGTAYQHALELKVQQINDSGVLGARKVRLQVKDNRSDPTQSMRNVAALTSDPAVSAIIMGSCDACAVGAAKTVNDKQVPTIALAAATAVTNPIADRRYMFKLGPNAADDAAAIATELRRRGVKKVALLHTDDAYGQESVDTLTGELSKAGIKLSGAQSVKTTDTDVSHAMNLLAATRPDAVVVWTPAEQAMLAATAAQQSAYSGALLFDARAAGNLFLGAGARATDNATMVFTQTMVIDDVIATTPAKAARKQWFNAYTARFGGYNGFSSFAADAVQLITDAVVRAGGSAGASSRNSVRDILETSQMDGLSGPIRMTPDNHSGLMPQALTMLVARNGRWRLAG
jgi:branched-chain amino acid transport system substrate-binding protein